jgi:hypothetical protein
MNKSRRMTLGGACCTHERRKKCIQRFNMNILRGKRSLERHMIRWESDIKMDLKLLG